MRVQIYQNWDQWRKLFEILSSLFGKRSGGTRAAKKEGQETINWIVRHAKYLSRSSAPSHHSLNKGNNPNALFCPYHACQTYLYYQEDTWEQVVSTALLVHIGFQSLSYTHSAEHHLIHSSASGFLKLSCVFCCQEVRKKRDNPQQVLGEA